MKSKCIVFKWGLILLFFVSLSIDVICQEVPDSTSSFVLKDQQIRLNFVWPGASYEKRIDSTGSINLYLLLIPDFYMPSLSVRKYMDRKERHIDGRALKNNSGYYLAITNAWVFQYFGDNTSRILETEDGLQSISIAPLIGIQIDLAYNFNLDINLGPSLGFERGNWSKLRTGLMGSLAFGYVFK